MISYNMHAVLVNYCIVFIVYERMNEMVEISVENICKFTSRGQKKPYKKLRVVLCSLR